MLFFFSSLPSTPTNLTQYKAIQGQLETAVGTEEIEMQHNYVKFIESIIDLKNLINL